MNKFYLVNIQMGGIDPKVISGEFNDYSLLLSAARVKAKDLNNAEDTLAYLVIEPHCSPRIETFTNAELEETITNELSGLSA